MALGVLLLLFIILMITSVIIQVLLYKGKNESKNNVFIINMLLGLFISYLAFTSLPINYTGLRTLAIVWGVISILAMLVKLKKGKFVPASKVMLSIAIIGGLAQLFS